MSPETTESSISTPTIDIAALPQVRKPGRVQIKSWVPDVEGSVLEQATNLSNLPFAIRHVALMPDANAGYGMPIWGALFADRAVMPSGSARLGCAVGRRPAAFNRIEWFRGPRVSG
jgi:hypothetical protein